MDRGKAGLTVFFEGPFWVGVFERVEDGKLSVCRVVFGSEPRDYEVWEFIILYVYTRIIPLAPIASHISASDTTIPSIVLGLIPFKSLLYPML